MLTATACASAKPGVKPIKLFDSEGLYLLVKPTGSKLWRLKYYFLKNERLHSLGSFPEISLAEARVERQRIKDLVAAGVDPAMDKKQKVANAIDASKATFEVVGREWLELNKSGWKPRYAEDMRHRLETDVFPEVGHLPIENITRAEMLAVVRKIEDRGAHEIALRAIRVSGKIFQYGRLTDRCTSDPCADLKALLKPYKKKHQNAIEAEHISKFLQDLNRNEIRAYPASLRATKLLMLTFVRTTELISAKKSEFLLDEREWRIPADKMKMKRDHIVPLSSQAVELFKKQIAESGNSEWVFPNKQHRGTHMSNNTILDVLYRLGYKGDMTGHGFRALAMSTIMERLGYRFEVVDRQLAHARKSSTDAAYDRATFLTERRKMMQAWADYLDAEMASSASVN
jgi:integrase